MPSFDIVSELDIEEAKNAVDNAARELETRYDFRGANAAFEWNSTEQSVKLSSDSDFQLEQMMDILRMKLTKRGVDISTLDRKEIQKSGKSCYLNVGFKQGIETDVAKKIIKLIKEEKIKVQTAIQGEQLRVTGKKRDDLQAVISLVKQANLGQPFQYKNFRD